MRFTCHGCGRVYVVSQELSGRAFRMRCKACGATVSVRPEAVAAQPVPATHPAASSAPAAAPVPASVAAEQGAPRAPREGGRGEGASTREAEPPPPKPRLKTVPRRASLVPTFVLSAILALVVGLSIYFGRDPGPDATKAPIGRLAGEPPTSRIDDAGRERR